MDAIFSIISLLLLFFQRVRFCRFQWCEVHHSHIIYACPGVSCWNLIVIIPSHLFFCKLVLLHLSVKCLLLPICITCSLPPLLLHCSFFCALPLTHLSDLCARSLFLCIERGGCVRKNLLTRWILRYSIIIYHYFSHLQCKTQCKCVLFWVFLWSFETTKINVISLHSYFL